MAMRRNNRAQPYPRQQGMNDRWCVSCGDMIRNQAVEKPRICPRSNCRAPLALREGFDENGWGRCPNCDNFLTREMCYCQHCGRPNAEAIERRNRLHRADLQRQAQLDRQRVRELEARNLRQAQELEELRAALQLREDRELGDLMQEVEREMNAAPPGNEDAPAPIGNGQQGPDGVNPPVAGGPWDPME